MDSDELLLIHECLEGRPEAFRRLIESYQSPVFDLCWRMLGNAQDAEDAAQEVFVRLYRHLPEYKAGHKLANWLYTIALNLCRSRLRRRRLLRFFSLDGWLNPQEGETVLPEPASAEAAVERSLESREEAAQLEALVARMPESLREPFLLKYFREMEEPKIAEALGLSAGNVRVRLHRARAWLWERMGQGVTKPPDASK